MQENVFSAIKEIPILSQLSDDALEALASRAKKCQFPKHTHIISEGDESSSLYILLSGKVRVFSSDQDGKEVTLLIQTPVSYFGELALLSDEPRSASVTSLEKTTCAVISRSDFQQWLKSKPEAALGLIQDLAATVRRLTDKVKQLALSNVYERTVQVLQDLAVEEQGVFVIYNRPTQQELANMVGASREMINKIIKELTKGGYVVIQDKTLRIEKKLPAAW